MNSVTQPEKLETEKMYEGIIQIFERLQNRFIKYEKNNEKDESQQTVDYLVKLAGSIGYTAQVHSGLAKAYQHEKRLSDLEKKFSNLPPEVLKQLMNKGR